MTGEPTHTVSRERMAPELMFSSERHTSQISNTASKVQWPLRFAFSYIQLDTQCYRRKTVEEVPLQHHENMMIHVPPTINYFFESVATISARYTVLQTKNSV